MGNASNTKTYFWENLVSGNLFVIGDHVGIASIIITQHKSLNTIIILYYDNHNTMKFSQRSHFSTIYSL